MEETQQRLVFPELLKHLLPEPLRQFWQWALSSPHNRTSTKAFPLGGCRKLVATAEASGDIVLTLQGMPEDPIYGCYTVEFERMSGCEGFDDYDFPQRLAGTRAGISVSDLPRSIRVSPADGIESINRVTATILDTGFPKGVYLFTPEADYLQQPNEGAVVLVKAEGRVSLRRGTLYREWSTSIDELGPRPPMEAASLKWTGGTFSLLEGNLSTLSLGYMRAVATGGRRLLLLHAGHGAIVSHGTDSDSRICGDESFWKPFRCHGVGTRLFFEDGELQTETIFFNKANDRRQ